MNIKQKKIQKKKEEELKKKQEITNSRVIINFRDAKGVELNSKFDISLDTNIKELNELLNTTLNNDNSDNVKYSFFYNNYEIRDNINELIYNFPLNEFSSEKVFVLDYHPESIYNVRPITRISTSLPGHDEAVLDVKFSSDGNYLCSGSGDKTIRFWDLNTETPIKKCEGHLGWVQVLSFSPDCSKLASGDSLGTICIWLTKEKTLKTTLKGHKKFISAICWEPYHLNPDCNKIVSSSKDFTVKIWNVNMGNCIQTFNFHSACVTKVIWSGIGNIYSSSEDKSIKIINSNGKYLGSLDGHSHWVNCLSLNTEYVLNNSYHDFSVTNTTADSSVYKERCLAKFNKIYNLHKEILVTGSDDCTIILWKPEISNKPIKRLPGHQNAINQIQFSPNGLFFISASFDKSIKLWNVISDSCLHTFRGHIASVYVLSWSLDSKLFLSGSKDTTLKVWSIKEKKLIYDLPGHADEIYSIDWSFDGSKVASGGKDKMVRIWKN